MRYGAERMITLDSPTLMDFNPYKAVEEKLQMKVTKKENTYTFKFSNGYQKIKTLKNNMQVKMYYTFLEEVLKKYSKENKPEKEYQSHFTLHKWVYAAKLKFHISKMVNE